MPYTQVGYPGHYGPSVHCEHHGIISARFVSLYDDKPKSSPDLHITYIHDPEMQLGKDTAVSLHDLILKSFEALFAPKDR